MCADVVNHVVPSAGGSAASVPGAGEIERIRPVRTNVILLHVLVEILGIELLLAASLPLTEQHFLGRIGYGCTSIVVRSTLQIIILVVVVIIL